MSFFTRFWNWWNNVGKPRGHYGWKRGLMDTRDYPFIAKDVITVEILPSKVDLSTPDDPVFDQASVGSCTGNAIAGAMQKMLKIEGYLDFQFSRLFIYYNERVIEGTINSDAGAMIRDGFKSINSLGACHESIWPYNTTQYATKPTADAYADAQMHKAITYKRIFNNVIPSDMKACLASNRPFVFGFVVYQSFESASVAKTGIIPMPQAGEKILGGHAVLCVGYDDSTKMFKCRNSWGIGWGDRGYFYIPYDYLTNPQLADDFWTIELET